MDSRSYNGSGTRDGDFLLGANSATAEDDVSAVRNARYLPPSRFTSRPAPRLSNSASSHTAPTRLSNSASSRSTSSAPVRSTAATQVSKHLGVLLATCKKSNSEQIRTSIKVFMAQVKNQYGFTPQYDLYPKYGRYGFTGRYVVCIKNWTVYYLIQGLDEDGKEMTEEVENPKAAEKEAAFEAEICRRNVEERVVMSVIRNGKRGKHRVTCSELVRPVYSLGLLGRNSWGDVLDIEMKLDEEYGPDLIQKRKYIIPPPRVVFNDVQRQEHSLLESKAIEFGPFYLDSKALEGKNPYVLFAQNLPEGIYEHTIRRWFEPICDHPFTVKMETRRAGLCVRVSFKEKSIDSHRVFYMYKDRVMELRGEDHRIRFNYFILNVLPEHRERIRKQMERKNARKSRGRGRGNGKGRGNGRGRGNHYNGRSPRHGDRSNSGDNYQGNRNNERYSRNYGGQYNQSNYQNGGQRNQNGGRGNYKGKSPRRGNIYHPASNSVSNGHYPSRSASPSFVSPNGFSNSLLRLLPDTMK